MRWNRCTWIFLIIFSWLTQTSAAQQDNPPASPGDTTVRVAAVSFVPKKLDLEGNADRLERAFREAAKGDAKVAVGPEGTLDGYVVNQIIAANFLRKG